MTIENEEPPTLTKYGRMRERYLREHRKILYINLLTSGKLYEHLADIDTSACDMAEYLIKEMAKKQGVTEELKATDMMRWRELRRACRALTGAWVRHHSQPETWTDDYHHCRRARSARNRGHGPSLTNSEKGNEVVHHGRRQGYCHR